MNQLQTSGGRQIFLLPIHSSVDLITNSSSELFMLPTSKTEESVKAMVKELATLQTGEDEDPFSNYWLKPELTTFEMDWDPPQSFINVLEGLLTSASWDGKAVGFFSVEERNKISRLEMLWRFDCEPHEENGISVKQLQKREEVKAQALRALGCSPEATLADACATIEPLWVKLEPLIAPAAAYVRQIFPTLSQVHAEMILFDYSNYLVHPAGREYIVGNQDRWNSPVRQAHHKLTEALESRGLPEEVVNYFHYHWREPLKGRFVGLVSFSDNSVPESFMDLIQATVPGTLSWHLG